MIPSLRSKAAFLPKRATPSREAQAPLRFGGRSAEAV
jgi:hypothetical protein